MADTREPGPRADRRGFLRALSLVPRDPAPPAPVAASEPSALAPAAPEPRRVNVAPRVVPPVRR